MRSTTLFSVALLLGGALTAQTVNNRIGFTAGFDTSYIDRAGANTIVADVLNHYDERDYRDWMLDPADPTGTNYVCKGSIFVLQDQVANTPETYTVVGYDEDPAMQDFPNPTAVWFRTGSINYPAMPATYPTPTGPIAWIITVTFTSPPTPKGDKWLGLGLPQPTTGNWPTDGLSPHMAFDRTPTTTATALLDLPGPGITTISAPNIACYMPTTSGTPAGPAIYPAGTPGNLREVHFDVIANCTGGVVVTQTNQTQYPSSNPSTTNTLVPQGGTTNMLSGQNPDINDFSLSVPPRADDIGFLVTEANLPNSLVVLMVSFGPSPVGSLPLSTLSAAFAHPNTRGNVCINFTNAATLIGLTDANGRSQTMLTLTPATRAILGTAAPIDLWYQGFVLNSAATGGQLELHATGCGIQHL